MGSYPIPLSRNLLSLLQELELSRHFSLLASGTRSPKQLQTFLTFTYGLLILQTTTLSSSTFYVDVYEYLTCPIWASIEEVMHVQTLAITGATPKPLLSRDIALLKVPYLLFHTSIQGTHRVSLHKVPIAYGLTLVTPSLHEWEVFPTPRALTHTKIIWVFSPTTPQVMSVIPGSPCAHNVSGTPRGEVCKNCSSGWVL